MDLLTLMKRLETDSIDPVYLIHGPEGFLVSQFVTKIRDIVVSGPMADFNYCRQKVSDTDGASIVADAKSMPMMAARRLMILDDVDKLKTTDQKVLEPYLADPAPETCLVMIGSKFDLRKGLFAKANRRKQVHKAEPLEERDIASFVVARARERGVNLAEGAASAIANAVGSDCAALDDAVERLGLYAAGAFVTEAFVSEVVSSIRQHSVFEMVEAMGARRAPKAIVLLEELLSNREEPLRLSALLARHFRQLILAKVLSFQGAPQQEMAKTMGVPPFVAKKLAAQARGFNGVALERALSRLARTDIELKSSRRSSRLVLEAAVMDLCL